ncbi:MAG TPA: hypothetical protein VGB47_11155 [Thermoanaerobaculia bacterium]
MFSLLQEDLDFPFGFQMALEFQEAGSHQARAPGTTVFSLLPLALENYEEDEQ